MGRNLQGIKSMQITSATFGVSHKGKTYCVDMTVQDKSQNLRRAVVTVNDQSGRAILHQSMAARQLICPETAKRAVRLGIKQQADAKTAN